MMIEKMFPASRDDEFVPRIHDVIVVSCEVANNLYHKYIDQTTETGEDLLLLFHITSAPEHNEGCLAGKNIATLLPKLHQEFFPPES